MWTEILLYSFLLVILIQLIYFWIVFSRLAFYNPGRKKEEFHVEEPVSVVIAAKNEYYNLEKNLPSILLQNYPEFEVLVVNDASTDDSGELLKEMRGKYPKLTVINLEENRNFFKGKKFPLSVGIKSAKYDALLLTDADCKPASDQWIHQMASNFNEEKKLVLGYAPYYHKKGLLNRLIRFETFITGLQYLSYALSGLPYMGVGRNLAYQKDTFYASRGFQKHYKIISGDDDLFVNQAANKANTTIEVRQESFTFSEPKLRWKDWWIQKQRHLSTGRFYKTKHKFLLSFFLITSMLTYLIGIPMLVFKAHFYLVLAAIFIRFLSQFIIFNKSLNLLGEKKLLVISPLLEMLLLLLQPLIFISGILKKKDRWK